MPLTFQIEETIDAPRERVFEALTDVEAAREWLPSVVDVEKLTDGPVEVGTEWRETRTMFGSEASEVIELREWAPPEHVQMLTDGSRGSSKRGVYVFDYYLQAPSPNRTEVRLEAEIRDLGTVMNFLGRFITGPFKRAIEKDLVAMKEHLEAEAASPPPRADAAPRSEV